MTAKGMMRVIQLEYCVKGFIDRMFNIHIMFNNVRFSWAGGSSMLRDLQKEETSVHLDSPFGNFTGFVESNLSAKIGAGEGRGALFQD